MSDTCPVCGKGDGELFVAEDLEVGSRYVSHLACVEKLEAALIGMEEGALFKELVSYKALAERHIDEAEAKVEHLYEVLEQNAAELKALKAANGNLRSALEDARRGDMST